MINNVKTLVAAAAVSTLATSAFAAPVAISADVDLSQSFYSFSTTLNETDDGAMFTFTVTEALNIATISVSGTGSSGAIASTTFQIVNPDVPAGPFEEFTSLGGGGASTVVGQAYGVGDVFTVEFAESADQEISYTVSFPVAEVPVPAAGLLLLGALGGFAGLRRRKKA